MLFCCVGKLPSQRWRFSSTGRCRERNRNSKINRKNKNKSIEKQNMFFNLTKIEEDIKSLLLFWYLFIFYFSIYLLSFSVRDCLPFFQGRLSVYWQGLSGSWPLYGQPEQLAVETLKLL